jgi:predicted ATP-grasp superfamily ATP-dependent carboligase
MRDALVVDFSRLPGVEVVTTHDRRLAKHPAQAQIVAEPAAERRLFRRLAADADWSLVIAPEWGGLLLERARWVVESRGRLLGPGPGLIQIAANKHQTARVLGSAGIPVPIGRLIDPATKPPHDFPYPAVIKPVDGAGSREIHFLRGPDDRLPASSRTRYLEQYHAGAAASVALLCGPACRLPLAPCRQLLSRDGRFRYLGGRLPLPAPLGARAVELAERAVATLPDTVGYIGVDLILGEAPDGSADTVIEVNPRLTTSYIGLRRATDANLAELMLLIAQGGRAEVPLPGETIDFAPDQSVGGGP